MNPIEMALMVLKFTTPVGFAVIGESIAQRAGILSIGLEGFMLSGAFGGFVIANSTGNPWLGLLGGAGLGLLASLISALFTVLLSADHVVIGTTVNLLALGLTGTLFRAWYGDSGALVKSPSLPSVGIPNLDFVMILLLLGAGFATFWLFKTKWGLLNRAAGEYPKAVESVGISVVKLRFGAACICGLLAGLGGAYLSVGIAASFAENMTSGRGFVAIAMVTFGRWNPWKGLLAALLIGAAEAFQYRLQALGGVLPAQFYLALPYVLALGVLVFIGKGTTAPAALGSPYQRER